MFSLSKNKDFCESYLQLQKKANGPGIENRKITSGHYHMDASPAQTQHIVRIARYSSNQKEPSKSYFCLLIIHMANSKSVLRQKL